MSKLKEIENNILQKKKIIRDQPLPLILNGVPFTSSSRIKHILEGELDESETKRRFLLDRRESWLPKTIWNVITPVIISILTLLITKYLGW